MGPVRLLTFQTFAEKKIQNLCLSSMAATTAESMPLKGFAGTQGDASKRPASWKVIDTRAHA